MIAAARGESLSWVMEQMIYDYFGFKVPDYVGTRQPSPINARTYSKIIRTAA